MGHEGERGVPGDGKGRRDEVGRSGIWPASGPVPPHNAMPLVGQGELAGEPPEPRGADDVADAGTFELDPVCGTLVDVAQGERAEFAGHAYYFDSIGCRERFEAAPARFATLPERRAPDLGA
jgi:YHS domain-containing protein